MRSTCGRTKNNNIYGRKYLIYNRFYISSLTASYGLPLHSYMYVWVGPCYIASGKV